MRKIKTNKKKSKDDLIEVPMSVRNKAMELLKKMCNNDDIFKFLEIILNIQALEEDLYLYSFKHTLFGMEYMTDRNERFRAQTTIKEAIPVLYERYKIILEPTLDLEIATLLFDITELFTKYAGLPNKILTDFSKAKTEKSKKFIEYLTELERGFKENVIDYLGDDPCVDGKFKMKFVEVTNWLTNSFYNRINTNNINELFSYDILNQSIQNKVLKLSNEANSRICYSTWAFKNWKNLCYYINEMTARCTLVGLAIPKLQELGADKKQLTHLKSTMTRCGNLINNLYNLLNYGEDNPTDEEKKEVEDFYGMLPINQLEGVMNLEKLIA